MSECVVTGVVRDLSGNIVSNGEIQFARQTDVFLYDGSVRQPDLVAVRTDGGGAISVPLVPGNYRVSLRTNQGQRSFRIAVPELATAFLGDLMTPSAAEIVVISPLVVQAQVYASEAEAAADRAEGYATRAAFVSANTATPGLGLTDGQVVTAAGVPYLRQTSATAISDLQGWLPAANRWQTDINPTASVPWLNISPSTVPQPQNHLFVRQNTAQRGDSIAVQIQRVVDADNGLINPKALRVLTSVTEETSQTEWAISGELDNFIDTGSTGNTATSGVANKYGLAQVFGGHFQSNDHNLFASTTAVTSVVGTEINIQAVGSDHPTLNDGFGARRVLDIIPRTNTNVLNWDVGPGNFGEAEIGTGIAVRADDVTDARFRFGVAVYDLAANPNKMNTGVRIQTGGVYGLHTSGANTTAHIFSDGAPTYGAIFAGTYSSGTAIRIPSGAYLAMEGTNTIRTAWGVTANVWGFFNGASERFGLAMTATPTIRLNGTTVVTTRRTGWVAPTGTATRTTFDTATVTTAQLAERVKGLIDDLVTHGLIGP